MRADLKIDKMAIDGFQLESEQGSKIKASIERELAVMLANRGAINLIQSKHYLSVLSKCMVGVDNPDALGKQIAREIYRRICDE